MAMEVHPGEVGPGADPSATAVAQQAGPEGQGQLFPDALAYPTYGDTDKIPAVGGRSRRPDEPGPARWLRVAVAVVALAVIAAGTALGLVKAGVIGNGNVNGGGSGTSGAPPAHHSSATNPKTPLLERDVDRSGHRLLQHRRAGLSGHGYHDDGTVLGEHRGRGPAPQLRGHPRARDEPEGDPPRTIPGGRRCRRHAGHGDLGPPVGHTDPALRAVQLPVHPQALSKAAQAAHSASEGLRHEARQSCSASRAGPAKWSQLDALRYRHQNVVEENRRDGGASACDAGHHESRLPLRSRGARRPRLTRRS